MKTENSAQRSVLITGASQGIGEAIARRVAADGFLPVLHCRRQRERAEKLANELVLQFPGGRPRVLQFDVADRDAASAALLADIETHGIYYGVVCNAGIAADNAFPAMTGEEWDSVLRVNLDAFYNVLRPLVMPMVQARRPGRIVTLSSLSGQAGNRGQVNYSAAKAGIIGATKALAVELAKRRITVNCVAPGLIETAMLEPEIMARILPAIPARRAGKPEEVAAAVSFLLGDEAAYITRQVIAVNGGML
ncbi:MAG: 3-oxoacyl-ACP reductase FabG [Candidatus Accumulibacter sp.]|jgi:3-oxoacyl-[acyl-carrier protein] reductase|nr:3-oxoacyl-ACP reductase FabG [Accumulibacter sp.]